MPSSRRGDADIQRRLAEAKPPVLGTFIGGSTLDDARSRWCWDLVWVAPAFVPLAAHLGHDAELLVAGIGPVLEAPRKGTPVRAGGHAAACIEQAAELLDFLLRGRRLVSLSWESIDITHRDGVVVRLFESSHCFGPPQQPRIIVLALDALVLDWVEQVERMGVCVDHPLRGMSAKEARAFMADFLASTPSWADFDGDEQAGGSRREHLLDFGQGPDAFPPGD